MPSYQVTIHTARGYQYIIEADTAQDAETYAVNSYAEAGDDGVILYEKRLEVESEEVPTALTFLAEAVTEARSAAEGDSNDEEISRLQLALDMALELVPGWDKVNPAQPTAWFEKDEPEEGLTHPLVTGPPLLIDEMIGINPTGI